MVRIFDGEYDLLDKILYNAQTSISSVRVIRLLLAMTYLESNRA